MRMARILIVEDEAIVAADMKNRLTAMGHQVVEEVASGEEAVTAASELEIDAILLDIVLQGEMDGIGAAEIIRETSDVPIIYLTAYNDDETVERAKPTMPSGYLIKPINERELSTTLEMALYKHHMDRRCREGDLRYRALFESSSDLIYLLDLNGQFVDLNPAALKILGFTKSEMGERSVGDIMDEDQLKSTQGLMEEINKTGTHHKPEEFNIRCSDGSRIWIETTASLIYHDGNPRFIQGVARDITERKAVEEKMEEEIRSLKNELNGTGIPLEPASETANGREKAYDLDSNVSYLITDPTPHPAFNIFHDQVRHGHQGLCISRMKPDTVKSRYGLEKTPFIWLTGNRSDDVVCIEPKAIPKLSQAVQDFLGKTDRGIILLSGIEYLIAQNGFKAVLNLLYLLNDKVMVDENMMLVYVNPDSLSEQELNLLRSELSSLD